MVAHHIIYAFVAWNCFELCIFRNIGAELRNNLSILLRGMDVVKSLLSFWSWLPEMLTGSFGNTPSSNTDALKRILQFFIIKVLLQQIEGRLDGLADSWRSAGGTLACIIMGKCQF